MLAVQVFLPFAFGYFMSYLLRVVNAVIAPDLIAEMGLTAADLGLLTAANFLAFGLFQIPLGILLDKYGPRRTEAALMVITAVGALLFGLAADTTELIIGRALIGLGTSACLMAAFKAYSYWFPAERIPMVNGFQMMVGGLGAMSASVPIDLALDYTDWRGVFFILSGMALAASALIFALVPKHDRAPSTETFIQQVQGVRRVFSSFEFWRLAPATVLAQTTFLSLQALWAGPWLKDVTGVDGGQVAFILLMANAMMVVGSFVQGVLPAKLSGAGISANAIGVTGMALFAVTTVVIALYGTYAPLAVWMAFGFFGAFAILPYATIPQAFPKELTGRVITGLNLMVFGGAFAAQWGIGEVIDMWPRIGDGQFNPDGYQVAFLIMAGLQTVGLVWALLFRRASRA